MRVNMVMDTLGTLGLATEAPLKLVPVRKKWNFVLGQSLLEFAVLWFLQAKGKALVNLCGPYADLIWNTLIFSSFTFSQAKGKALFNLCGPDADLIWNILIFAFCQAAKHTADAIILEVTFSSIVTGLKWGCAACINNIQKFAQFLLKNVLPFIVYFSSACLTGNAPLTAVLLLILGALALSKKTMSKQVLSFFVLMGLVFLLGIQVVEGSRLKAVSDVKASLPPPSFKGMFSAEKKKTPVPYPPPASGPQRGQ